jgi:hypothetical protein
MEHERSGISRMDSRPPIKALEGKLRGNDSAFYLTRSEIS